MIFKIEQIHLSGLTQLQGGLDGVHYTHNAGVADQNKTSVCPSLFLHHVKEN